MLAHTCDVLALLRITARPLPVHANEARLELYMDGRYAAIAANEARIELYMDGRYAASRKRSQDRSRYMMSTIAPAEARTGQSLAVGDASGDPPFHSLYD